MADSKAKKGKKRKDKKTPQSTGDEDSSSVSSVSERDRSDTSGQIGRRVGSAAVTINRDEYLQAYRDLAFDRNQLLIKNSLLHRRLAEYYRKRKLEHVLKPLENAPHFEEKYQQKLFTYQELKEKEEIEMADIKTKLSAVQEEYEKKLEQAEKNFDDLQSYERTTGTGLIYSKKGKPIADKTVERFLTLQRRKSEQSSALCLRYIRARNAVTELESIVRKLEMIAPGLNVAQYEQLQIDKQNYLSKIEERDDELIKNRTNCTEHNQMLAHIREKMHHTDEVIDFAECDLGDAEIELIRAREDLGHIKSKRDKLRWSLEAERIKAGLLTRRDLLRDYQNAGDEVVRLREKKKILENQIKKTTAQLREARKRMLLETCSVDNTEDALIVCPNF
ncbi:coiled-coil domain-containing protein 96-like [Danaus plexippus]|uniref:coiled-coil domain-containing protein 96-like n=1 Tax=Danaus plexippus TaxID=13037 RepID=UPI002AB16F4A|nr:coiled-coil domain-containing protein 96-like [Danaus plexippus]